MEKATRSELKEDCERLIRQNNSFAEINKELSKELKRERRIISMLKASDIVTADQLELLEAIVAPLD